MAEQCESQQMLAIFEPLSSVNLDRILNIKVLIHEIRRGRCVCFFLHTFFFGGESEESAHTPATGNSKIKTKTATGRKLKRKENMYCERIKTKLWLAV